MATNNPAERLVSGLGGRGETAALFRVSPEAIRLWTLKGIPTDRALDVEEATATWEKPISAKEILEFSRQAKAIA